MNRLKQAFSAFVSKVSAAKLGHLPTYFRISLGLALFLALAIGAKAMINRATILRLTPLSVTVAPEADLPSEVQALETQTVGLAFDRDTTTVYTAYGRSQVTVGFEGIEEIHRLRLFGPAPYSIAVFTVDTQGNMTAVGQWSNLNLSNLPAGWNNFDLVNPVNAQSLVIKLTPNSSAGASGIQEMEFWGKGIAQNEKDGSSWDALFQSATAPSTLLVSGREYLPTAPVTDSTPVTIGGTAAPATQTFTVNLPMNGQSYRKAWLMYDVYGLSHWIAVPRTINSIGAASIGGEAAGGWPLPGSTQWSTQVEAIHPLWLNQGPNYFSFSMPNGVVNPYAIRNVKIVVEEDNGSNLIDNIQASAGNPAVLLDGDETTGWKPYQDGLGGTNPTPSLTLNLYRPEQLDSIWLYLSGGISGKVIESVHQAGVWKLLGDMTNGQGLGSGWQSLPVSATGAVDAVILEFRGGDGSQSGIMEAMAQGSGTGKAYGQTVEVTYPDQGQFYGQEAYIRGFLGQPDDGSGQAQVLLGSQPAQVMNGQFEGIVSMPQVGIASGATAWAVTITAIYPDGNQLTQVVNLNQQESGAAGAGSGTYAQMLNPSQSQVLNQMGARLAVDANALQTKVNLQVVPLGTADLEPLNPGMTNVTGGPYRGYRFLPHGTHFNSQVKIGLPYDPTMLPNGKTAADIRTFYFDPSRGLWMPLPISDVDPSGQMLTSLTTHFTDFINATITLPDTPQESNFNPTQLKGIQYADPGDKINLIKAPSGNNQGSANLSYPIEVPLGRHGLAPSLQVEYDSANGNSWMGQGWDLTVPQITVETRWGAPRYNSSLETETYLLDGQMLVEESPSGPYMAHRMSGIGAGGTTPVTFINRNLSGPVTFHTRVEGDFKRIIRYGNSPSTYAWEVDEKDGIRHFYGGKSAHVQGGSPEGGTTDPAVLTTDITNNQGNIFTWALRATEDLHGNCVMYHYDRGVTTGLGHDFYLGRITYTGTGENDGPYQVQFFHGQGKYVAGAGTTVITRPDASLYAKGGFVRYTSDVLDHVDVTLNGALIRRYQFTYLTGAFSRTLLSSIQQFGSGGEAFPGNTHSFSYFNDLDPTNSGVYTGFGPGVSWTTPKLQQLQNAAGLTAVGMSSPLLPINAIDTSETDGGGGHVYVGYAPPFDESKYESVGFKIGMGGDDTYEKLTLLDVDGDGLPDLVYEGTDGNFYYLKNESSNGSYSFSTTPQILNNLSGISHDSSFNITAGVENYVAVQALYDFTSQWDTQDVYLTDANGDGIPDLVANGQVYFGHIDGSGNVSFSPSSGGTPNPLGASQAVTVFPDLTVVAVEALKDPLVDTLRQWTAPYDGVVTISGPATLLPTPTPSGTATATPSSNDGVRAFIEWDKGVPGQGSYSNQSLAGVTILPAQAGIGQALSTAVTVSRGDRIYFRLQSIFDGSNDGTAWDPHIQYTKFTDTGSTVSGAVSDENGLDSASYQPSTDFTLAGMRGVTMSLPLSGTVSISGDFQKLGATSDGVTVLILKTTSSGGGVISAPTTLFAHGLDSTQTGTLAMSLEPALASLPVTNIVQQAASTPCTPTSAVTQVDQLQLEVQCNSNIDLSKISWQPVLSYTALAAPTPDPCTGLTAAPVTNNFPVISLPYQVDFYPEKSESPVDGAPQAPLSVTAPSVALQAAPTVPTPPTSPTPTPTAIPAGKGILYMNGTLQVNAPPASAVTLFASINGTTEFSQTVTAGTAAGTVSVTGELSQPVAAGDQLLLTLDAATTVDAGNLAWSPDLYYVNPFASDSALSGTATFTPDYEVATGSGGSPVTQVHYVFKPQVTAENVDFGINFGVGFAPLTQFVSAGNLYLTIKESQNRLYKSSAVDVSSANWSNTASVTELLTSSVATSSGTATSAIVQSGSVGISPVTFLADPGENLYFNFTADNETARSCVSGISLSTGSVPQVPFSFDSPGYYPERMGGGGFVAPVTNVVTFGVTQTLVVPNLGQPVSLTFHSPYRGWSYGGLENDPALAPLTVVVSGPGNGSEPATALFESDLVIPDLSNPTTTIYQPTVAVTGTSTPTTTPNPVTVITPPTMKGVFYYPGLVQVTALDPASGSITIVNSFNAWQGPSTQLYSAPGTVESSRLIKGTLFIPKTTAGSTSFGGSLAGIPSRSSNETNGTVGVGFSFLSGSFTAPAGSATGQSDYIDLNGDGYPDIINGASVSYTNPEGNLSLLPGDVSNLPMSVLRTSTNGSGSFGVGGSAADPELNSEGRGVAGRAPFGHIGAGGGARARSNAVSGRNQGGKGGASGGTGGKNGMKPLGSLAINIGNSTQNIDLIDMNGDGLPDQVTTDTNGHLLVYLNMGTSFAPNPITWPTGGTAVSCIGQSSSAGLNFGVGFNDGIYGFAGGASADTSYNSTEFEFADLNGDGLPDLVWNTPSSGLNHQWVVQFNTGSGFTAPVTWTGTANATIPLSWTSYISPALAPLQPLGLNWPGLPTSDLETNFSLDIGGGGYFTIPISLAIFGTIIINPGFDLDFSSSQQQTRLIDMTGSGFLDQITSASDGSLTWYQNQTGRTNLLRAVARPMGSTLTLEYSSANNSFSDPNGRWQLAQVSVFDGGQNHNAAKGGADWQVTQFSYGGGVTAVGAVTATTGGYYDRYDRDFAGYAAVTAIQMDTRGYIGGSAPATNAGLAPYRMTIDRYLNSNVFEKGLMSEESIEDGTGAVTYVDTQNIYQLLDITTQALEPVQNAGVSLLDNILFPQLVETDKSYSEVGAASPVTTYETYAYDAFGSVTLYVEGGDGPSDAVTASINYTGAAFAPANYLPSLPTTLTVSGAGGTLRQRTASYDPNNGDLVEVDRIDPVANTTSQDDMAYDGQGNLISETGPANLNGQRYQRSYQYDTIVGTYPVFSQDSFGYTSTESYDYRYGLPSVDVDENNNRIQWSYDDFGRMVTVVGPEEQQSGHFSVAFDYHPDAAIPFAHTANYDPFRGANATMDKGVFADGLDRAIQTTMTSTVFQGANQKALDETLVSGRVVFDHVGRVVQRYYPLEEPGTSSAPNTVFNNSYDASAAPVSAVFDPMDRSVSVLYPDGSTTSFSYAVALTGAGNQFLASFKDQDGNLRQNYGDVKGLVEKRLEYTSPTQAVTTQYQYDPVRELTRIVDANGNVTAITYDLLGRRTAVQSPDSGKTSYSYDPASNLVKEVTANLAAESKAVTYAYDYNRILSGNYPDFPRNNFSYTYGAPGAPANQADRIASVKDASGSLSLAYDVLGNAVTETRVVGIPSGNQWLGETAWDQGSLATTPVTYVTSFLWDDWARVQRMAYPDGEVLTYEYDAGGHPRAVAGIVPSGGAAQGSAGTFFPYVTRLEYDRFGSRVFQQNGNGTQSTSTYRPDNRRLLALSSLAAGVTFQNLNYSYDHIGNILGLVNQASSGEGGLAGPVTQGFQYDGLNRLTQATGLYSGAFNTETGQSFSSRYSLTMAYDNLHNITQKNQSVQDQTPGQGFQPDNSLTYDWTYQYQATQPHAPSSIGTRNFTYDADGNQTGFSDLAGTPRTIIWDEENRMEGVEDGAGALSDGGIRFTYDAAGSRILKIDHSNQLTAYPNQFYTVLNPLAGANAQADKHIFLGSNRVATHMVTAAVSTTGSSGNPSVPAEWAGSWGVSIAAGDTDAVNFGSPGNFITVQQDNVPVLGAPQTWTKGVQVLGTANSCQVLSLLNPKPQGGFFQVSFDNQPGFVPVNTAVVGIPTACLQSSLASQTASIMPKNSFVFFYHDDHLGSTGYLTDQNGTLSEHIEYLPFGETWTQQDRGTQLFPDYEFTGQELDPETGLYYFGARYYDARTSLWQSPDPALGDFLPDASGNAELAGEGGVFASQNLSLYSYAHENPLVVVDPDGREPKVAAKFQNRAKAHKALMEFDELSQKLSKRVITLQKKGQKQFFWSGRRVLKDETGKEVFYGGEDNAKRVASLHNGFTLEGAMKEAGIRERMPEWDNDAPETKEVWDKISGVYRDLANGPGVKVGAVLGDLNPAGSVWTRVERQGIDSPIDVHDAHHGGHTKTLFDKSQMSLWWRLSPQKAGPSVLGRLFKTVSNPLGAANDRLFYPSAPVTLEDRHFLPGLTRDPSAYPSVFMQLDPDLTVKDDFDAGFGLEAGSGLRGQSPVSLLFAAGPSGPAKNN